VFENDTWAERLQRTLKEVIYAFFQQKWHLVDDGSEKGFSIDFLDVVDMLKGIEVLRVDRTEPMTKIYATVIDPDVNSVRGVHTLVHQVLSHVDEDFCIFIPLHNEEALRFWYITGTASHGHEGMVIIKRADIPQVVY